MKYYTVVIPYTETNATPWHPTEPTGPFSTITRGAFTTPDEAEQWANRHIPGHDYSIKEFDYSDFLA